MFNILLTCIWKFMQKSEPEFFSDFLKVIQVAVVIWNQKLKTIEILIFLNIVCIVYVAFICPKLLLVS